MNKALILSLALAAGLSLVCSPVLATGKHRPGFCSATADIALKACGHDVKDNYWLTVGNCINESDKEESRECLQDAYADLREEREVCDDQHEARLDLCDAIGERRYDPDFDPANFEDPTEIGSSVTANFPLIPGTRWVYEADGEIITVTVTDETKLIEGVTCLTVHDLVTDEDGAAIEDTDDWYAQDLQGNVWYCGEISQSLELFEGDDPEQPELVDIDGSWKTGRDYAKPGIQMFAHPERKIGKTYRQEMALNEAEDVAEIVTVEGEEGTDAADCGDPPECLVTREYTPKEPDVVEFKYYAPGVGLILEVNPETGDRTELVEFTTP
jgi:hypothetical protein